MILGTEEPQPTGTMDFVSQMAREDLADRGLKLPEALGGASLGQIGFDVVNTTANMLPSLALGTLGGGAVGAVAIGASAAGNAYNSAITEGYSKEQATNYAALVGASETALGYILGGIEATGGKMSKAVLNKVLPKIDNALAKSAVNVGEKMLSEFSEEYLQEVLTPVFENIALLENNEIDLLSEEAIYSGILGALSAGGIAVAGGKRVLSNNANVPDIYGNWYSSHREDFGKNLPNTFAEYKRMMYNQGKSKELKEIKEKIKVIENTPCELTQKKISHYMLEEGKKHYREFFNVGYTEENSLLLKYDIAKQYDMKKAFDFGTGYKEPNVTFSIFMDLGVTKKKRFRTVWQIDKPGDIPRIISCHEED